MKKKILLITHDQQEITNISPSLDDLGYDWTHAEDALAGLEIYESQKPDLIVVNALVPRGGGFEICRQIRQEYGDRTTKIIVISAVASGTIQVEARTKWGADEVILLPVPLAKMVQLIAFLLGDANERPTIKNISNIMVRRDSSIEVKPGKKKITRSGDLADIPFGRILAVLVKRNLSGFLRLGEAGNAREILLSDGRVLEMRSGYLPGLALGEVLSSLGWLDEQTLTPLIEQAKSTEQRLGVILRKNSLLDKAKLRDALVEQAILKLSDVFLWRKGVYEFVDAETSHLIDEPIDLLLAKATFCAARASVNPAGFRNDFRPWLKRHIQINETAAIRPNVIELTAEEKRFIYRLDKSRTVTEILKEKMLPHDEACTMLGALFHLGMVTF